MKRVISILLVTCLSGVFAISCETLRTDDMISTTGEVCFDVQPAAAKVYIDGDYAGMAKGCMTLARGPHTVVIMKDNFVTYEKDIYVGTARQDISVKLAPGKDKSKSPPGQDKVKVQEKEKTKSKEKTKNKKTPPGQEKKDSEG